MLQKSISRVKAYISIFCICTSIALWFKLKAQIFGKCNTNLSHKEVEWLDHNGSVMSH